MIQKRHYDLCVVGGGLSGVSIARDAAGRGVSVLLIERQDLAGASSSATSKIIRSGFFDIKQKSLFSGVKALKERDILYKNMRHLMRPIECVMPFEEGQTEKMMDRWRWSTALWAYNFFRNRKVLRGARFVFLDDKKPKNKKLNDFIKSPLREPKKEGDEEETPKDESYKRLRVLGNMKSDEEPYKPTQKVLMLTECLVDDTRLVISNAVDATLRGAEILTHTTCEKLQECDGYWRICLRNMQTQDFSDISASMVVNATGAWGPDFIDQMGIGKDDPDLPCVEFAKESHIILPRQYEGDHVYMLRQEDGRIVYVMPYEGNYTLVGASSETYKREGQKGYRDVQASQKEINYLINACNHSFKKDVTQRDVVFSYSAVRPILNDGRFHIYHHKRQKSPLISVYGGGFSQYRRIAEKVVDLLMSLSGRLLPSWSAHEPLYSSAFPSGNMQIYIKKQIQKYPWLPRGILERYVCAYGVHMEEILRHAEKLTDLGEYYGDGVYEAEVNYLKNYEWVLEIEDLLWRRSKLALHISEETEKALREVFLLQEEEMQNVA